MKKFKWQIVLGLVLVLLSIVFYLVHFLFFKDSHHIFIYLLGDIAFVPIEVLMVTLIIHRMLNHREKRVKLEKLNMIIGVFFTEIGSSLIGRIYELAPCYKEMKKDLALLDNWTDREFLAASRRVRKYDCEVDHNKCRWDELKDFMSGKRDFMLNLMGNPNLMEHESFTELLRAVSHITEEMVRRENINSLTEIDYQHLANDIKRVFRLLVSEWILYMKHLKKNYPYMYSLAVRTSPFSDNESAVVTQ